MSIVLLKEGASVEAVEQALKGLGLWPSRQVDEQGRTQAFGISAYSAAVDPEVVRGLEGVAALLSRPPAHPLVDQARGRAPEGLGWSARPMLIAGPCSAESPHQVEAAARMAATRGARLLRGGAFKPRTSPHAFSGHGHPALRWLKDAAEAHAMGLITEVLSEIDVSAVAEVADVLQIGSRNMQNFALLRRVGQAGRPVLLKRGMAASVDDWLLAGEHLLHAGAPSVIYCERGVRGFDPQTRNLLDLGAVALLKQVYGLPVIVDPSHAAGRRDLIPALTAAALAAGADGVMVEIHPTPGAAHSDGPQALDEAGLGEIARLLGVRP